VIDGRYRLEQPVGEGSSGRVYAALHLGLRTHVALKLLHDTDADEGLALAAFEREAEALGRLSHPHVVRVFDFGRERETGRAYLAMELLTGRSLATHLREHGRLESAAALDILEQVARAVDAAHAAGVLHRDIKPANVWLDQSGVAKVMDFGLARWLHESSRAAAPDTGSAQTDGTLGTPLYAAPEVLLGEGASTASDVYSLGVLAYELLTGAPPFRGSLVEVMAGHRQALPAPAPGLSAPVHAALCAWLAKAACERPSSAGAAVRRLRLAATQAQRARWQRQRVGLGAVLALLLLAAGQVLPDAVWPACERWWHDLRFGLAVSRSPDPRLLLMALESQQADPTQASLAERADEVAGVLAGILAAGARAIAVDVLLPARWSESPVFSRLVLEAGDALTLAAFVAPDGQVTGRTALAGLTAVALGPRRAGAAFGLVNVDEDADGVVRRGRLGYRAADGRVLPSWAAHAAAALAPARAPLSGGRFWIDFQIDERRLQRLSWEAVHDALVREPQVFRGRLVLVGANWNAAADDYHRVPGRSLSGLELQALQVATLTLGTAPRSVTPRACAFAAAVLASAALCAGMGARRARTRLVPMAAAALLWLIGSAICFVAAGWLVPVSTPLLLLLLGALGLLGGGTHLRPLSEGGRS
jgi:CHASE2 domain-containing sensor protein